MQKDEGVYGFFQGGKMHIHCHCFDQHSSLSSNKHGLTYYSRFCR